MFLFREQGWCSGGSTRFSPNWPGLISRHRRHMWHEFVVGSIPCSQRFSPGTPIYSSAQKPTLPNSISIWKARTHLTRAQELLSVSRVNNLQFTIFLNMMQEIIESPNRPWQRSMERAWTYHWLPLIRVSSVERRIIPRVRGMLPGTPTSVMIFISGCWLLRVWTRILKQGDSLLWHWLQMVCIENTIQYVVLGPRVKVINLNILPESSCNELKYSLKIAFMFLSIILKFQVPDINILLGIRKKATVFDGPWPTNLVLGPRLR